MSNTRAYFKDPNGVLDYEFDWTQWLETGDTIASHVATVVGAVKNSSANSTTSVTVWVSGGTVGINATIACRITTTAGRVDERTVTLRIREQ